MDRRGDTAEATPLVQAFDELKTGLTHVLKVLGDGGLDHLDGLQQLAFYQELEAFRNQLPLIDHQLILSGQALGLPDQLAQPTMGRVLTQALRISPTEAHRRVRAAEALAPRTSMLGLPQPPVRPVLAAAQADGQVNPDQVAIIERALTGVDRAGYDPAAIDAGEQLLTTFAATFGPPDLRRLADQVVDAIHPDGSRPDDELNHDRRHLRITPSPDGSYRGDLRLTGALGAKLTAVLTPLAAPRIDTITHPDGSVTEQVDPRTHGQRMHDALEDLCDRALRAGGLPDSGGTPASVIITIDLDNLLDRTGIGHTSNGATLTTPHILQLADQAEVIPTVLTATGAVLDLGRSRRIATPTQTYALIARDHGCSFPTCTHPPEYCERHHIQAWADGGLTDLDNLTLLCRYHHHNFASRGWTCQLNPDRLPEWTPPRWIDKTQTPLINHRILTKRADPP